MQQQTRSLALSRVEDELTPNTNSVRRGRGVGRLLPRGGMQDVGCFVLPELDA